MSVSRKYVDVLIVGGGPVGLTTGLELSRRGIKTLLVDREDGVVVHPRGTGVSERTMEYFRQWGIAEEVRAGYSDDLPLNQFFCESMSGFEYGVARYPSLGSTPTPKASPVTLRRCSQDWWDRSISKAYRALPLAELWYRHEYTGLIEEDGTGITAQVMDLDGEEAVEVRAEYLVGADGINSKVRDHIGAQKRQERLLHYSMSVLFEAPDLFGQLGREPGERFILIDEDGPWGNVTSIDGEDLFRLLVRGSTQHFDLDAFDPNEWVERAIGRSGLNWRVLSVRPWRREEWLASHYRRGRLFIAGDAAHAMSSSGGHGANTGITDAVNLSWKIVGAIRGWGGPWLLDSYEAERRPVAKRNIAFAQRNTRNWTPNVASLDGLLEDSKDGERLRQAVGRKLAEATKPEWESLGVKLGYRYDHSPVVVLDGTGAPADYPREYIPTARPGSRAPHIWLSDGKSILDLFGETFVLLRFDTDFSTAGLEMAAASVSLPFEVVDVSNGAAARLYEAPLVLVRPDGHVAWRGGVPSDAQVIIEQVRGA